MGATTALTATPASATRLVQNFIGEYTARSVAADPLAAAGLHLVRQSDGNYAARATPALDATSYAAARASAAVQTALQGFRLGG